MHETSFVVWRSTVMRNESFRPQERLRSRKDFARVFAERCSAGDEVMVVYAAPNGLSWSRIGISTSRRVGNAVQRNYMRRRIREAFRRQENEFPVGFDLVCIPRAKAKQKGLNVAASLIQLTRQAINRLGRRAGRL